MNFLGEGKSVLGLADLSPFRHPARFPSQHRRAVLEMYIGSVHLFLRSLPQHLWEVFPSSPLTRDYVVAIPRQEAMVPE